MEPVGREFNTLKVIAMRPSLRDNEGIAKEPDQRAILTGLISEVVE